MSRERDERLILAALEWWDFDGSYGTAEALVEGGPNEAFDFIIAQADEVQS